MGGTVKKAHSHNSTLASSESNWGSVNKIKLPRKAFANQGEPGKKSTWGYPHHHIVGGKTLDDNGVYTDGTMYLHKSGLNAAWAAAQGARSGVEASPAIKAHIQKHRSALGLTEKDEVMVLPEVEIAFKKQDEEHQIVYGVVYSPLRVDTDNETIMPDDVMKMAWSFLGSGKIYKIDVQHDLKESGCQVVESWIARKGDPDFPEGSWVMGVWCPDEIWEQVKAGELNGFSFYGTSKKYPAKVLMEVAKQIAGVTEKSTKKIIPIHEHAFIVNVDNEGAIVSGKTDLVLVHSHLITKGTVTDDELDHNHRIALE